MSSPQGPAATVAGCAGLCRPWGKADGNVGGQLAWGLSRGVGTSEPEWHQLLR